MEKRQKWLLAAASAMIGLAAAIFVLSEIVSNESNAARSGQTFDASTEVDSSEVRSNEPEAAFIPDADNPEPPTTAAATPAFRLFEHLKQQLLELAEPVPDMPQWIEAIGRQYNSGNEPMTFLEADLDRDGKAEEWVGVLREEQRSAISGEVEHWTAYGIVIVYRDGRFELSSFEFPYESFGKAKLAALDDLNGDGAPEAVWASYESGAHSSLATITVSVWSGSQLARLEDSVKMINVESITVDEGHLLLTGGIVASVGAGNWQREYTDVYVLEQQSLQHADRVFQQAVNPYHKLQDGLWAEALGHGDRAMTDYEEAMVMKVDHYKGYDFEYDGEWVEGGTNEEHERTFERIVKKFALLRKIRLAEIRGGASEEAACRIAKKEAGFEEEWLYYLNSPAGYANTHWNEWNVCRIVEQPEL